MNLLRKLAKYYAISEVGTEYIHDDETVTDEEMDQLVNILKDRSKEEEFKQLVEYYKSLILKDKEDKNTKRKK